MILGLIEPGRRIRVPRLALPPAGLSTGMGVRGEAPLGPFSPTSLPNCLWWGRVSNATTTQTGNNTPCSEWRDETANARHLSQATAGLRGHYQSGGGGAFGSNNRPYLSFDVNNPSYMDTASFSATPTLPVTIYVIGRVNNNTNDYKLIHNKDTGSSLDLTIGANFSSMRTIATNGSALIANGTGGNWFVANMICCVLFNGASSSIFQNNITTASATGTTGTNSTGPYGLRIASDTGAFNRNWPGNIAAIHMYEALHDATYRAHVMNASATYYGGITVSP